MGNHPISSEKHFRIKTFRVVSFSIVQSWHTCGWILGFSLLRSIYFITESHFPKSTGPFSNSHAFLHAVPFAQNTFPWNSTIIRPYYRVLLACLFYGLPFSLRHEQLELRDQDTFIFVYPEATIVSCK